jgi:hypothetical protein
MLLFRVAGLLTDWTIMCPADKKALMREYINEIKLEAGKTLWFPYKCLNIT